MNDSGETRKIGSYIAPSPELGELPMELWQPGEFHTKGEESKGLSEFLGRDVNFPAPAPGGASLSSTSNQGVDPLLGYSRSNLCSTNDFLADGNRFDAPNDHASSTCSDNSPSFSSLMQPRDSVVNPMSYSHSGRDNHIGSDLQFQFAEESMNESSSVMMDDVHVPPPSSAGPSPTYACKESPDGSRNLHRMPPRSSYAEEADHIIGCSGDSWLSTPGEQDMDGQQSLENGSAGDRQNHHRRYPSLHSHRFFSEDEPAFSMAESPRLSKPAHSLSISSAASMASMASMASSASGSTMPPSRPPTRPPTVSAMANNMANNSMANNAMPNNAMTNNVITNNAMTNNAMTNNAMTNNAMTNNAMANHAMVNNAMANNAMDGNRMDGNGMNLGGGHHGNMPFYGQPAHMTGSYAGSNQMKAKPPAWAHQNPSMVTKPRSKSSPRSGSRGRHSSKPHASTSDTQAELAAVAAELSKESKRQRSLSPHTPSVTSQSPFIDSQTPLPHHPIPAFAPPQAHLSEQKRPSNAEHRPSLPTHSMPPHLNMPTELPKSIPASVQNSSRSSMSGVPQRTQTSIVSSSFPSPPMHPLQGPHGSPMKGKPAPAPGSASRAPMPQSMDGRSRTWTRDVPADHADGHATRQHPAGSSESGMQADGTPAYMCPHCSAGFRVRGYSTRHMRKHADVMKFNCPLYHALPEESKCHQTGGFSRGDTFKMHMKARHFVYPKGTSRKNRTNCIGECAGCGKVFDNNEIWFKEHIMGGKCAKMQTNVKT